MEREPKTIRLPRAEYDRMLRHAQECAPEEACGLIGGRDEGETRIIERVYLLENTDHSPEHFSLDPKEQLQAVQEMRKSGLKPMGNWHSHPATPSRPSQEDIRLAFDKNATYMILSLALEPPVLNAFHIENGENLTEHLEII